MEAKVKKAFEASFNAYANSENIDASQVKHALENVFNAEKPFMDKVAEMDAVFDDYQQFEELREYTFDLLMINFFAEDVLKLEEDYLESEEWEAIEDETIERGSEMLNILLYLKECADDEIEPSLDDFLKEFLLVEEDEFQDEYEIYENVIANQLLVDSSYEQIAKVADTQSEEEEIYELFYPLVSFFYEQNPNEGQLGDFSKYAANKSLSLALYQLMINFNK